ncbi:unnamed protein product [Calypogeia fissa]
MTKSTRTLLLFLGMLVTVSHTVRASDPDLTTDFGISAISAANFTFTGFRNLQAGGKGVATPTFASFQQLPGLTGLGLTAVQFEFGPQSQISPHTHPRATEIFYVLSGVIDVGFVDTNNDLFETTLQTGDLFVFPKGLLHFQRNNGWSSASGFSALSSENPGTLLVSNALFTAGGKGLPDNVLATALGASVQTVDSIKSALGGSAPPSSAPSPSGY